MQHSTTSTGVKAGWAVVEGARLDGTPYWTVRKDNVVSVHRFITELEAVKYARVLDRVENPHA